VRLNGCGDVNGFEIAIREIGHFLPTLSIHD
jgi:hypothetical protein